MTYMIDRERFETAADALDPSSGLEIEAAYFGRGMYGATCIGVSGSFAVVAQFLFELGRLAE